MEFYSILDAEISFVLMGFFRCGVFAVYRLSGRQGHLIILLIIFYVGYNQGESVRQETTDILQMKRQVYTQLKC